MSGLKRIILAITFTLAVISCGFFAQETRAEDEKNGDGKYTLVIYDLYGESDEPVCGVKFTVSKVANLSEKGVFELTGDYKDCDVTNDDINHLELASDVNAVIDKLMDKEIIDPEAVTAKTDETGRIEITGLSAGMYLLTAEDLEMQDGVLQSTPSIVVLPGDSGNETTVHPKTQVLASQIVGTETEDDGTDTDPTSATVADETTSGSVISQIISSVLAGDNSPVLLLSIIVIVAFIVIIIEIIFVITRRKKNKKEENGADE